MGYFIHSLVMAYVVCTLSMVLLEQVLKLQDGNWNPHQKARIRSFMTHLHAEKIIPGSLEMLSSHINSVALSGLTARGSLINLFCYRKTSLLYPSFIALSKFHSVASIRRVETCFFHWCSSEIFNSSTWTWFIVMAESTTNFFELSFDEINAMKKKDFVSEIEQLKGKVIVDNNIRKSLETYGVEWKN